MKKKLPPEIIEICERPGYLDHLQNRQFRVRAEVYNEKSKKWDMLTEDEGNEIWLVEYPPHSRMAHYVLQGVKGAITEDDIPF